MFLPFYYEKKIKTEDLSANLNTVNQLSYETYKTLLSNLLFIWFRVCFGLVECCNSNWCLNNLLVDLIFFLCVEDLNLFFLLNYLFKSQSFRFLRFFLMENSAVEQESSWWSFRLTSTS